MCHRVPHGIDKVSQHPCNGDQGGVNGLQVLPDPKVVFLLQPLGLLKLGHAAVCTASGLLGLKDRRVDSWAMIMWAYSCWRDSVGFAIASLSLTFGVADLCGCLNCGGFRAMGCDTCSRIPQP
ncbi:hypothetical protein NDU88_004829 [Pleurodeles waltl]|uniref:Uncharacterized protein n=1 Tax=Pleurodeles waltl TaxID=8319 RepID=A0AAV7UJ81_PLEWA|nr:hypothetical protein NDU88_004829 [Pleurodeles waltl]